MSESKPSAAAVRIASESGGMGGNYFQVIRNADAEIQPLIALLSACRSRFVSYGIPEPPEFDAILSRARGQNA